MTTPGIIWCEHCGTPHMLTDRFCTKTGKPLDRNINRVAQPKDHPFVGKVVGDRYKILHLIGQGGMGEVYEAENLVLKRKVAVKVVAAKRRRDDDDAVARLKREAQALVALQHPNICDVYDVGSMPDGSPFIVLERLVGETLLVRNRTSPRLSPPAVADIFSQILAGLRVAHASGIIHRDLKPANVFLVARQGCEPLVKLLDFGFATNVVGTSVDGWERITRPGRACGTTHYMAPEQLRAQAIDARADIFAVGIMLYESLTRRHPFPGESLADIAARILKDDPPPPSTLRASVPTSYDAVVRRALAKKADDRYRTALEFQVALLAARPMADEDAPDSVTDTVPMLPRLPAPSGSSSDGS